MKDVNASNCGREDALVAFLYGELAEDESQLFRRHLDGCAACSSELESFQGVRSSVVAWRNESLGHVSSPALVPFATVPKPSALEAVRQFFNLAPLWLKGSLAVASILFCLLAGLVVARWQTGPVRPTAVAPGVETPATPYSQQQVDAIVAQRVKEELGRIKQAQEESGGKTETVTTAGIPARRNVRGLEVAANAKARRPLSKTEREQLAVDLRLIQASNENEFELLDDGINQQAP